MKKVIVVIILLLTIVFIFGQSSLSGTESKIESEEVREMLTPVMENVVGEGNVTSGLVRKLAHFAEYAVLGFELALLLYCFGAEGWQNTVNSLFFALLIAMVDETIQIFSGRGSQIQDVWLDFIGSCCGHFVGRKLLQLINSIQRTLQRRRRREGE